MPWCVGEHFKKEERTTEAVCDGKKKVGAADTNCIMLRAAWKSFKVCTTQLKSIVALRLAPAVLNRHNFQQLAFTLRIPGIAVGHKWDKRYAFDIYGFCSIGQSNSETETKRQDQSKLLTQMIMKALKEERKWNKRSITGTENVAWSMKHYVKKPTSFPL